MPKIDNRLLIYDKTTSLIVYSKNLLNKYPKAERFALVTRINNLLYKILENIIRAWKEYSVSNKLKYLKAIDKEIHMSYLAWKGHVVHINSKGLINDI